MTVNGVLATLLAGGRRRAAHRGTGHRPLRGSTTCSGRSLADPHDFPLLNDAFAVDPLVIDVQPGADRRPIRSSSSTWSPAPAGGAVFPRTVVRAGAGVDRRRGRDPGRRRRRSAGRPAEPTGVRRRPRRPAEHLVVPVTELEVADDATLAYCQRPVAGSGHLAARPPGQHHRGRRHPVRASPSRSAASYARLRTDSALAGRVGHQPAAGRLHRPGRPDARLPHAAGPPAPRGRPATCCSWGRWPTRAHSVYSGLIRVRAGRGPVRRHADQPQPGARRGRPRRLGAQPRHRGERRAVQPRVDGRARSTRTSATTSSRGASSPSVAEQLIVAGFFDEHRRPGPRRRCPGPGRPGPGRAVRGDRWLSPGDGADGAAAVTVRLCGRDDLAAGRGPAVRRGRAPGGPGPHRRRLLRRRRPLQPRGLLAGRRRGAGRTSARSSAPSTARRSTCAPASPARCRPPGRCRSTTVVVEGDDVSVVVP